MSKADDPPVLHPQKPASGCAAHRAAPLASHNALRLDDLDAPAAAEIEMTAGYVLGPNVATSRGGTITRRLARPITISP